jgi:hypothetical protein
MNGPGSNNVFNSIEPQVEGIEKIYSRYQTIVFTVKSKNYDMLDHRKLEVQTYSFSARARVCVCVYSH